MLASGIVGALFALACSSTPTPAAPGGPVTLTVGIPQSRQLDPSHGVPALTQTISFERLTGNDASGRTTARLLESWTVSADGLTWRLRLRPHVVFQDGTPLTPADVRQSIESARTHPFFGSVSVCLPDVADVSSGDADVVVRLKRRCSYLLDDLDSTITRKTADGRTVGTGPFSVVSESADEIAMEANRHYYMGRPAIDRIVVRPYDTLRTAWAEMMRGKVDFLWEVGPDTAEFLRDQKAVAVRSFLNYFVYTINLNSARPVFRDPATRRALNLGVDRAALVAQGLKGQGRPADDLIWPSYWAHDPSEPPAAHDAGEAAHLLRRANARRDGRGPVLEFTCLVPANFTIYERLALLVQQQLRTLDVEMHVESVPVEDYHRRIARGDFDAVMLLLVGGPYATIQYRFWHSPAGSPRWNYWGYRNASVDASLDLMRDAPDDDAFRAAMRSFTRAMRDDPPAIALAWGDTVQAVSRHFDVPETAAGRDALHVISGWRPNVTGDIRR